MQTQTAGLAFHVHHDILVEWCYDTEERREFIRTNKPEAEQPRRLQLLKFVRGELPREVQDAERAYIDVTRVYHEAHRASDEAWRAFGKAVRAFGEARRAYRDAQRALDEARRARGEARQALDGALANHKDEIEALHARECPDCHWDGRTIFPFPWDGRTTA